MMRNPILFLCGVLLLAASACSKEAPPAAPPPPEVLVTEPIQRDVPVYDGTGRPGRRLPGRRDPGPRRGLPRDGGLHRGLAGPQGAAALPDRPEAAAGGAREREGQPRDRRRRGSRRPTTTSSAHAAGRAAGGQPAGARQRDSRAGRGDRPGRRRTRRPWRRPQIDLGYTTITSPIDGLIGTTKVKAGNLVGRGESTLLVTISQIDPILFRAGIAEAEYLEGGQADAGAAGAGVVQTREDAHPAHPRRRHGAPARGPARRRRAQRRHDHRHASRCRSSSRTPSGSCGPASSAA